jgi:hypothetical protein
MQQAMLEAGAGLGAGAGASGWGIWRGGPGLQHVSTTLTQCVHRGQWGALSRVCHASWP